MAYAVTCSSCGARFSVGEELFQRKFAGRVVTVRCKQCQSSIRLNAIVPPQPPSATAKPARATASAAQLPRPARPRPPLKNPGPQAAEPNRDSPGPFVALSPGLLGDPSPPDDGDLFDAPPPSAPGLVDLTDAAESEPPSAGARHSGTRDAGQTTPNRAASDDMDFLLGLSGSPGTTATLLGPPLLSLADAPAAPREAEAPSAPTTARSPSAADAAPAEPARPPARRGWTLVLAGASLAVVALLIRFVLAAKAPEPAPPEPSALASSPATTPAPPAVAVTAPEPSASLEDLDIAPAPKPDAPVRRTPPRAASSDPQAPATPEPSSDAKQPAPSATPTTSTEAPAGPFSRTAAESALGGAVNEASACRKPGDPSGTASVVVTFAPSGRVTSATISGPPFAGTPTGGCIASTLRRARVPAFEGEKVTVRKTVVID